MAPTSTYLVVEQEEDKMKKEIQKSASSPFLTLHMTPHPSSAKMTRSASMCSASLYVIIESRGDEFVAPRTQPVGWRRYLGVFYTLLAVNMLSLTNTIMKKYSHVHPFNVGIWYSPTAAAVALVCILYHKCYARGSLSQGLLPLKDNKKNVALVFLRGIITSIIFYLSVAAFRYISAADLRTVISAVVIAVFLFGWLFLGEKCGVVPIVTAIVAVCGIGIMTRPPILTGKEEFDQNTLIGIGIAVVTMIIIALQLVIIRSMSEVYHGVSNLIAMLWGGTQGVILSWCWGELNLPAKEDIIGMSLAGLCLGSALTFLVLALQNEEAGVVALVRTSEVIFVFFWQWVIVGTYPDIISVAGAILVVSGVVTVTLRTWVDTLPKDNPMKRRLRFILL